jgi:hypothetical protein
VRDRIFDDRARDDSSPTAHSESSFAFLNRVAGEFWAQARNLVQEWADGVAQDAEYNELRQRLRSRDNDQFRSAFLELYLHESLIRAGYAVTVHPAVQGTTRRPDFLGQRDGEDVYVEAIAPGASPAAKATASRRAVLFDTVDRVRHTNFLLWLDSLNEGSDPPSSARLRDELRRWLDSLDPDAIVDLEHAPRWSWQHNGWSATFRAVPKRADVRRVREHERSIGVYGHGEAEFIDDAPAIRRALAEKHHAYGDLGAPFIIAVGTYIFDRDRWHSTNALYGALGVQWYEAPSGEVVTREVRQPGGYFGHPPGWQNDNVSGVLIVNQLMPYNVPRVETTLWRHPRPLHPLPPDVGLPAEVLTLDGPRLTETPPPTGSSEFFGLPDPWPQGEPWPNQST